MGGLLGAGVFSGVLNFVAGGGGYLRDNELKGVSCGCGFQLIYVSMRDGF